MINGSSSPREAGLILALAVLLAFVYNAFSPKGLPLIRVAPPTQAVPDSELFNPPSPPKDSVKLPPVNPESSNVRGPEVIAPLHKKALQNPDSMKAVVEADKKKTSFRIITLDQLTRLLKSGRGMLFDARSEEDYAKGHIRGARNVFGEEPAKHFEQLAPLPRDTLVIIYCNNPECHLGRAFGEFLRGLEFTNMVLYDDGWDGWEKAKMPVDTVQVGF